MTTNTDTQAHGGGVEAVRVSDWLAVAKAAGAHGVRYRTNMALEAFLTDIAAALASPAATSAETQGGDGDDGTVAQRKEHAEPDEGRQDAGSTPAGFAASICDCERAHNGLGISGRECDCQADNERCTGCYGTGWDSNAERFCHCEDGAIAALAPSTSAATRGEPYAWVRRWAYDGVDVMAMKRKDRPRGWNLLDVTKSKILPDDVALYTSPPAPAESAQVKEGRSDG